MENNNNQIESSQSLDNRRSPLRETATEQREQDSKKCKKTFKKIMWIIVAVLAFVIIVQVAVADKYSAQVLVIEGEKKVGVNPTDEKLDFGDLSADTSATRYVTLSAGGVNAFVSVFKFGSISELVKLSENNFTMKKGDEKKLEFSLYMPLSAPIGEKYTGYVWIFKLPKVW